MEDSNKTFIITLLSVIFILVMGFGIGYYAYMDDYPITKDTDKVVRYVDSHTKVSVEKKYGEVTYIRGYLDEDTGTHVVMAGKTPISVPNPPDLYHELTFKDGKERTIKADEVYFTVNNQLKHAELEYRSIQLRNSPKLNINMLIAPSKDIKVFKEQSQGYYDQCLTTTTLYNDFINI